MQMKRIWLVVALLLCVLLAGCSLGATSGAASSMKQHADATPSPTPAPKPTTLYVAIQQTVYAVDLLTGAKRWTYHTFMPDGPNGIQPIDALTVAGDFALFTDSADKTVTALSSTDGSVKWHADAKFADSLNIILVASGVVVASSTCLQCQSSTSAFDLATGKMLWSQPTGGADWAVGNGVIYKARFLNGGNAQTPSDGVLQALNPRTGAITWQVTGHAFKQLALIGDTLYSATFDTLYVINSRSGAQEASYPYNSGGWMSPHGPDLLFGDQTTMYALDGVTHTIKWQNPLKGLCGGVTSGVIACNMISATGQPSDNTYSGLDATTGALSWTHTDLGPIPWGAYGDNGLFFVDGPHLTVDAIDAHSGAIRWTFKHTGGGRGVAIGQDGLLYLTIIDTDYSATVSHDKVYALSESDGSTRWEADFEATPGSNVIVSLG